MRMFGGPLRGRGQGRAEGEDKQDAAAKRVSHDDSAVGERELCLKLDGLSENASHQKFQADSQSITGLNPLRFGISTLGSVTAFISAFASTFPFSRSTNAVTAWRA